MKYDEFKKQWSRFGSKPSRLITCASPTNIFNIVADTYVYHPRDGNVPEYLTFYRIEPNKGLHLLVAEICPKFIKKVD